MIQRFLNATVVDGTGSAGYGADVLVEDDTIKAILPPSKAKEEQGYDCTSLYLVPGFIDMHGHSDLEVLRNPAMRPKIGQGITTEVAGNCGIGVYPARKGDPFLKELTSDVLGPYPQVGWEDFASYRQTWSEKGSGTNMAFLQSHSALRSFALSGNPNRIATDAEVKKMCQLLDTSLSQGCVGLSTGLYYAPCAFADRKELLSLLSVVKAHDALFSVHQRCEGSSIVESITEVLDLASMSNVRLQISHLKVIGRENQALISTVLSLIEKARLSGLDVQFDQYPYEYGSTSLFSLLPPQYLRLSREDLQAVLASRKERVAIQQEMEEGNGWDSIASLCGWDDISILTLDSNRRYEGMSLTKIASLRGQSPYDAFFDLLMEEKGSALMIDITETQQTLKQILTHPLMCFGTDALFAGKKTHPRSYQAAIHLLDRYYKQQQVLPLETLIAKMSGCGALRLGLSDRGFIKEGMKADLVLLDLAHLEDRSSQKDPDAQSLGIQMVMVNGGIAYQEGRYTDATTGRLITV